MTPQLSLKILRNHGPGPTLPGSCMPGTVTSRRGTSGGAGGKTDDA